MDRAGWLAQRQATVVAEYDAEASEYIAHDYPSETQRRWVAELMARLSRGSLVLDAPCGTGKYFPLIVGAGHRVVGVDQSAGMLEQARRRGLAESLEQRTLQSLEFDGAFDAVLTIDAMENVPPEDWPVVVANLSRALKSKGLLYMTVEEIDEARIDAAFEDLHQTGVPAVRGEVVEGDVAGYHYYARREQVLKWFADAGLEVREETHKREASDWGYRHFMLRAISGR
jgi:cyclopropane fatty-acyl-phospholipid synthase-like methyltransferase